MAQTPSTDLGDKTRLEAILAAVGPVDGLRIVDIGCGEGQITRELASRGGVVAGYDPFLEGSESDWTALGQGRFRLTKAAAHMIPEPDGGVDLVLFVFSLHHVPKTSLGPALREAQRLLRPSGKLCVMEPLAEGPAQYIMELYHDETAVRRDAAQALKDHATPAFGSERILYFDEVRNMSDFDAFAEQAIAGTRYSDYTETEVLAPQVRQRFDEMVATCGGRFEQPVRMHLFA